MDRAREGVPPRSGESSPHADYPSGSPFVQLESVHALRAGGELHEGAKLDIQDRPAGRAR